MKSFKLALLALCVSVAAPTAFASIEDGSGANGEMFLSVYDLAAKVSFTFDLGVHMNDFTPATEHNLNYDLSADSNWTDFLAMVDNNNIRYSIGAMNTVGNVGQSYLSTTQATLATVKTQTNTGLKGFSIANAYINAVNGLNGFTPVEVNESVVHATTGTTDQAYFGLGGEKWYGKAVFNSGAKVGQDTNFYKLTVSSTKGLEKATVDLYDGYWNLSQAGQLSYVTAAVPEAETYAMMAIGLGLVAFARRRKQAQ